MGWLGNQIGPINWETLYPFLELKISRPLDFPALRVLSFGAGVQSTTMLLMSLRGMFGPPPDLAIFADTQFEPSQVYDHLQWVQNEVARLSNGQVTVNIVSAGNIKTDHLQGTNTTGQRFASMPLYTQDGKGMGRRQCTREYKIEPIEKEIRRLLGVAKGKRVPKGVMVEQWIGISTDEIQRIKKNKRPWAHNRFPLIERRLSRSDCRVWFERNYPGVPLVKSACSACPFRDNSMWRWLKKNAPEDFAEAVAFDKAIRENGTTLKGMHSQQFVHRSGIPLDQADLDEIDIDDLFQNECDGYCGV